MAHYCPSCELLYDRLRPNCPVCGGRLRSDEQSCSELEAEGYRYAPGVIPPGKPDSVSRPSCPEDSDYYARLRQVYQYQQKTPSESTPPPSRTHEVRQNPVTVPTYERHEAARFPPVQEEPPRVPELDDSSFDLPFQRDDIPEEIPEEPLDPEQNQDQEQTEGDKTPGFGSPGSSCHWIRRAGLRTRRRRQPDPPDQPPLIGSRTLMRLILAAVIILALVFLWINRFVIASAIWDIISALLPCILTIVVIGWIIRSIFRRR